MNTNVYYNIFVLCICMEIMGYLAHIHINKIHNKMWKVIKLMNTIFVTHKNIHTASSVIKCSHNDRIGKRIVRITQ